MSAISNLERMNCSHWEESKTAKRGQCYIQHGVSYVTRFSKDSWESTYFKTFWMIWIWPSYSRECEQYWLCWHLVTETSSSTVKKPKLELLYDLWWMWKHGGIWHWRCLSKSTDYENSPASSSRTQNTAITGHPAQHRMNGLSSSTSWKF